MKQAGNYNYEITVSTDKVKKPLTALEQQTEKLGSKMKEAFSLSKVFDVAMQAAGKFITFIGDGFKDLAKYNTSVASSLNGWSSSVKNLQVSLATSPIAQTLLGILDSINYRMGYISERASLVDINIKRIASSSGDVLSIQSVISGLTDKQVKDQADYINDQLEQVKNGKASLETVKNNVGYSEKYSKALNKQLEVIKEKENLQAQSKTVEIAEKQYKLGEISKDSLIKQYETLKSITKEKSDQLDIEIKLVELNKVKETKALGLEQYKKDVDIYKKTLVDLAKEIDKKEQEIVMRQMEELPDNGKKPTYSEKLVFSQQRSRDVIKLDSIITKLRNDLEIAKNRKIPQLTTYYTSTSGFDTKGFSEDVSQLLKEEYDSLNKINEATKEAIESEKEWNKLKKETGVVEKDTTKLIQNSANGLIEFAKIVDENTISIGKLVDENKALEESKFKLSQQYGGGFEQFNTYAKIEAGIQSGSIPIEGKEQKIKELVGYEEAVRNYIDAKSKFDKSVEDSVKRTGEMISKASDYIETFAGTYSSTMDDLSNSTLSVSEQSSMAVENASKDVISTLAQEIPYVGGLVSLLITNLWETESEQRQKAMENIERETARFEHNISMNKSISTTEQKLFYEDQLIYLKSIGAEESSIWTTEEKIVSLREQETTELEAQIEATKELDRLGNKKNTTAKQQYEYWKGVSKSRTEDIKGSKELSRIVGTDASTQLSGIVAEEARLVGYEKDLYGGTHTMQESNQLGALITASKEIIKKAKEDYAFTVATQKLYDTETSSFESAQKYAEEQATLLYIPMIQEDMANDEFLLSTNQITKEEYKKRYSDKVALIKTENEKLGGMFSTVYSQYMGETDETKKAGLKTYLDEISSLMLSQTDINAMDLKLYESKTEELEKQSSLLTDMISTKIKLAGLDLDNLYTQRQITSQLQTSGFTKDQLKEFYASNNTMSGSTRGVGRLQNIGSVVINVNEASGQTVESGVNASILNTISEDTTK